jgi:prepilin-type N-terminal cleavage/methylation domain-containing protein
MNNPKEKGFSLIETMIALVILTIGILGALSALTFGIVNVRGSEQRLRAKEIARSSIDTVFSLRDLILFDSQFTGMTYDWNTMQTSNGVNGGIFLPGWTPIRENPGLDGIFGTADDACPVGGACESAGNPVVEGFQRNVVIVDLPQNGLVQKRQITVAVSYWVGGLQRVESQSTLIADLPAYK